MLTYTQRNIALWSFVGISIVLFEFVYEIIYELILEIVEIFAETIVFSLEWVELGIEESIKSIFQLSHQQTQLITFYLLLGIAVLFLVYLWFKIPVILNRIKRNLRASWLRKKRRTAYFWRSLSLWKKVKYVTIPLMGASSMVFLI